MADNDERAAAVSRLPPQPIEKKEDKVARVDRECVIDGQDLPQSGNEPTVNGAEPPKHLIDLAVEVSGWSPCRSKRGVVICSGENVVTHGYNYKPRGFDCDGSETCKATCRTTAVHAEQQALLSAGTKASGAEMLHVKSINGALVPSGGPSCVQCSKLALVAGITGIWLYHVDGWRRYETAEWYRQAVDAARLPPAPAPQREPEIDYDALDPLIRGVVLKLTGLGFQTTDSGDGISKPAGARVFEVPHVVCRVTPGTLVAESQRLMGHLPSDWRVEASYCPNDESAILLATGPAERSAYSSGCTEPEFPQWWERFGRALAGDARINNEMLALAGFCAGRAERMSLKGAQVAPAPAPAWQPMCHACGHLATAHSGRPDGENDACTVCNCPRLHTLVTVNADAGRELVMTTSLQRFYNLTTWLLSEAPSGVLSDGASPGYHHAMRAVTALRDELRRDKLVEHDEGFWHLGQKKAADPTHGQPLPPPPDKEK